MFIVNLILGFFTNNKNKSSIWIIILIMIGIPVIYFIYNGITNMFEQKFTIKRVVDTNKELHKVIITKDKLHKIDLDSVTKVTKDISDVKQFSKDVQSDINHIDDKKYIELKKELKLIKKDIPKKSKYKITDKGIVIKPKKDIKVNVKTVIITIPDEKQITKVYDLKDDKEILIVRKQEYEITGLNNYNNILKMYNKVSGDKK